MMAPVRAAAVPIMVNDLTGKMGRAVAEAVVARGDACCFLVPVAFSGLAKDPVDVNGVEVEVKAITDPNAGDVLDALKEKYPGLIVVDYTLPAAVNANADFYVEHEARTNDDDDDDARERRRVDTTRDGSTWTMMGGGG